MATIALEGMRFFAHHGLYEEEKILGNDFVVDVYLTANVINAAIDDQLYRAETAAAKAADSKKKKRDDSITTTINYETVYLVCEAVMRERYNLLETVAEQIAMDLKHQFKFVQEMKIRVRKLNPPLGGRVESAWVEVDGQFSKKCARCERPLLCYGDGTCWCMNLDRAIYAKTMEQLKTHYGDRCLCKECLDFFVK